MNETTLLTVCANARHTACWLNGADFQAKFACYLQGNANPSVVHVPSVFTTGQQPKVIHHQKLLLSSACRSDTVCVEALRMVQLSGLCLLAFHHFVRLTLSLPL